MLWFCVCDCVRVCLSGCPSCLLACLSVSMAISTVLPVCNAFFILLILSSVYAVLGTNFFETRSPEFFRDFLTALFTMFQVLSVSLI